MRCFQVFGVLSGVLLFNQLLSGYHAVGQQYDIQSSRGIELDNRIQTRSTRPGPQWGNGGSTNPYYDGEPNPGKDIADIIRILDGAIKNAPKPQNNPPQYYQPPPQYPQYRPQPQPTYSRPVERVVTPKSNPKPPEKKLAAKPNTKAPQDWSLASTAETQLLNKVVEQAANDKLDELSKTLGNATKDKEVAKILEEGKEKIKKGEKLDADWETRLADAVNKASTNPDTQMPAGTDSKKLSEMATQLKDTMDSNAFLKGNNQSGNNGGMSNVIFVPVLPTDDLLITPNGTIIIGTGGEGGMQSAVLSTSDVLGMPIGAGQPEPESTADFSKRVKSGVLLTNPAENSVEINYVLGNNSYSMKAGYTQTLAEGQKWVIKFNRGESFGQAQYTLEDGTYAFGTSDKGWELYKSGVSVTIDNSANDASFFYNIDNTQEEVGPGQTKTHKSLYPIFVRFDRGDGGKEMQKKVSKASHTLQVAVDPKDGYWNLYPAGPSQAAPSALEALTGESAKTKSRLARLRGLIPQTAN